MRTLLGVGTPKQWMAGASSLLEALAVTPSSGHPLERTPAAEQEIDRFLTEVLVIGTMG